MPPHLARKAWSDLAYLHTNGGMKDCTVSRQQCEVEIVFFEQFPGIAGPYTNFSKQTGTEYSYSTSFPQPILMGAAFDDELITKVATVISMEARAFNNANRCVASHVVWQALLTSS